ncbi:hypothetical protein D9O40_21550 [Clostridium autoethanogenum]|uniref:Uncharacterized protein n=1 Tax=Clostridium autoethanogenum TaxID=84023 RepID=A0A3M0S019_9CLOT|nr:DUF6506 family protein [Clostridium autoethanogenum]RMC91922.1 hypothetical protein D9O40_21550 [Clostridium autoethanogenum]
MKAAFIFLAPGANSAIHKSVIKTLKMELISVGVSSYDEACKVVVDLVSDGISAVELCGGFGIKGTAKVKEVIKGKIPVGAVRFDIHPGLGNKSGDEIF